MSNRRFSTAWRTVENDGGRRILGEQSTQQRTTSYQLCVSLEKNDDWKDRHTKRSSKVFGRMRSARGLRDSLTERRLAFSWWRKDWFDSWFGFSSFKEEIGEDGFDFNSPDKSMTDELTVWFVRLGFSIGFVVLGLVWGREFFVEGDFCGLFLFFMHSVSRWMFILDSKTYKMKWV